MQGSYLTAILAHPAELRGSKAFCATLLALCFLALFVVNAAATDGSPRGTKRAREPLSPVQAVATAAAAAAGTGAYIARAAS